MASAVTRALDVARSTKALHLGDIGLTSVPTAVWTHTNLVRLDLSNNDLRELPADVRNLTALQELWLNGNPLEALPTTIEFCTQLRFIDVRGTMIRDLPKEVSRLPRLADIALSQRALTPQLAAAASGGTRSLLQHLAFKDESRQISEILRRKLDTDVYREVSGTAHGAALIEALVAQCADTFQDLETFRQVTRNAERLFPADLDIADAGAIAKLYKSLKRDNEKQKLAAEVELKVRAIYFDRIRVELVPDMVKSIYQHVTVLEDVKFMLFFARELFPDTPEEVSGELMLRNIHALRKRRAEERAAATAMLAKALGGLYPDREPPELQELSERMAKALKGAVGDLKALASDAAEYFPAEFTSARPRRILLAFSKAKAEKMGL